MIGICSSAVLGCSGKTLMLGLCLGWQLWVTEWKDTKHFAGFPQLGNIIDASENVQVYVISPTFKIK